MKWWGWLGVVILLIGLYIIGSEPYHYPLSPKILFAFGLLVVGAILLLLRNLGKKYLQKRIIIGK